MAAMENAKIKTVINLENSVDAMESYSGYPGSYYSQCKVLNPEMNYDFGSEEFSDKVRDCVTFIAENDGPYLIHCKEGKDRTGILCALIELFAGDPIESVEKDYMETYRSFYNVKPEDEVYEIILNSNLRKTLCALLQVDSLDIPDLQQKTKEYLLSIGLTDKDLAKLSSRLHN